MAVFQWSGATDATYATDTNWVGGTNPTGATAPDLKFTLGTNGVTAVDRSAGTDQDPASVVVGGSFSGSIGTASAGLQFDDIANTLVVECGAGGASQIINVRYDTCPLTIVRRTSSSQYGCVIYAGTTTRLVVSGGNVFIGANATITELEVWHEPGMPNPVVWIEAGATIATINASAGVILCYAAIATKCTLSGTAVLYYRPASSLTLAWLEAIGRGAKAFLEGTANYTVTLAVARDNAYVTTRAENEVSGRFVTFTNCRAFSGAVIDIKYNQDINTNAALEFGGLVKGASSKTTYISGGMAA